MTRVGTSIVVGVASLLLCASAMGRGLRLFDHTSALTKLSLVANASYTYAGVGFYSERVPGQQQWGLENADVDPSVRTAGFYSTRPFDQDEGVDDRGLWVM